jgi:hypothetical protein
MKVVGERVLVEQILTKKESKIILPGSQNKDSGYDAKFTVLQLGAKCPTGEGEIQLGEHPIFSKNVTFEGVKVIEETKVGNEIVKSVAHVVVHYEDIIGAE